MCPEHFFCKDTVQYLPIIKHSSFVCYFISIIYRLNFNNFNVLISNELTYSQNISHRLLILTADQLITEEHERGFVFFISCKLIKSKAYKDYIKSTTQSLLEYEEIWV